MPLIASSDPLLRQPACKVREDEDIAFIVKQLRAVMREAGGVGIAAPQIGLSYQICLIGQTYPLVCLNPQIIWQSEQKIIAEESCLSLPGERYLVERPQSLKMVYTNSNHQQRVCDLTDHLARVACHEIDHLHGILIDQSPNRIQQSLDETLSPSPPSLVAGSSKLNSDGGSQNSLILLGN
jgi:peptide deformylase